MRLLQSHSNIHILIRATAIQWNQIQTSTELHQPFRVVALTTPHPTVVDQQLLATAQSAPPLLIAVQEARSMYRNYFVLLKNRSGEKLEGSFRVNLLTETLICVKKVISRGSLF